MADVRPNRVKHKLQEGKPAIVVAINDADTIETLGSLDAVDGIWIEMEHGPVTWAALGGLSRACDLWGMSSLVRVNHCETWLIGRTLDCGVQGVLVPHVSTKEEAERAVRGAKYTPQGMRGMYGSRQGYGVPDYLQQANSEIMVIALIEDVGAVNNLSEILTIDHIDCFFVTRFDMAQSMGPQYLGHPDHPDVLAMRERAIKQIVAAGKVPGAGVDESNVDYYLEMGVRFLLTQTQSYATAGLQQFRRKVAARASTR